MSVTISHANQIYMKGFLVPTKDLEAYVGNPLGVMVDERTIPDGEHYLESLDGGAQIYKNIGGIRQKTRYRIAYNLNGRTVEKIEEKETTT